MKVKKIFSHQDTSMYRNGNFPAKTKQIRITQAAKKRSYIVTDGQGIVFEKIAVNTKYSTMVHRWEKMLILFVLWLTHFKVGRHIARNVCACVLPNLSLFSNPKRSYL